MKSRRIEEHLKRKFYDWLMSIPDDDLRKRIKNTAVITGGCIASLLLNEKVNDYDIYFTNPLVAADVARYYLDKIIENTGQEANKYAPSFDVKIDKERVRIYIKSAGVISETSDTKDYGYFEQQPDEATTQYVQRVFEWKEKVEKNLDRDSMDEMDKYRPVYITSNAITLSDDIQIIIRFTGTPRAIHDNFDFVHCTNYWFAKNGALTLRKDALENILNKELHYVGSKYPICSLFRLRKFLNAGWTITAGQILKIALQISDLDLNIPSVLEEQLIGVDVAYFSDVLNRMRKDDKDLVDRAYLIQLIDETF